MFAGPLSLGAESPILDTRISVLVSSSDHPPPLDSEQGQLESSGQRIISSFGKTKIIAFSLAIFSLSKFPDKEKMFFFVFFKIFPDIFFSGY